MAGLPVLADVQPLIVASPVAVPVIVGLALQLLAAWLTLPAAAGLVPVGVVLAASQAAGTARPAWPRWPG